VLKFLAIGANIRVWRAETGDAAFMIEQTVVWEMHDEGGGERQVHVESPKPLKAGRRGRGAMRVIRDGTPVVDSEPVIVDDGLVVRDHVVVGVCERPGVDEAEMGDIKKPFELAAGERGYVERRAGQLLEPVVVPVRRDGDRRRRRGVFEGVVVRPQTRPDEAVALHDRVGAQMHTERDLALGVRGDVHTATARTELETVVGAADPGPVAFASAGAERDAAVRADVVGDDDISGGAVDHEALVQERGPDWTRRDVAGQGNRIPVMGKDRPILGLECALARECAPFSGNLFNSSH